MNRRMLLVAACGACVACSTVADVDPGMRVDVLSDAPSPPGPGALANDRGDRIALTRAFLVTTSLELLACDGVADRLWERWIERRAWAHAVESPTRLGTAVVEALAAQPTPTTLGVIRPPPGAYCRARYTAGPADRDAVGLTADTPVAGLTLYLEGTVQRGSEPARPFQAASDAPLIAETDLPALQLSAETPHAALMIRKPIDHWFDGIDVDALDARALGLAVLANVSRSIAVERQ